MMKLKVYEDGSLIHVFISDESEVLEMAEAIRVDDPQWVVVLSEFSLNDHEGE